MAIALTPVKTVEGGDLILNHILGYGMVFLLDFTGNYVAGGEAITAPKTIKNSFKTVGAGNLYFVQISSRLGYTFDYDYVNDKVIVRQDAAAGAPSAEIPVAAYPAALLALAGANRVRGFALGR